MAEQLPFWSDDFDMDLPRVVPDWLELLGATADVELWTYSHTSHGRINCPVAWNELDGGLVSYFGTSPDGIAPRGYYVGAYKSGPVQCTFAEVVRDLWCHHQRAMMGHIRIVDDFSWQPFSDIMYHVRDGGDYADEKIKPQVDWARQWVKDCAKRMSGWLDDGELLGFDNGRPTP